VLAGGLLHRVLNFMGGCGGITFHPCRTCRRCFAEAALPGWISSDRTWADAYIGAYFKYAAAAVLSLSDARRGRCVTFLGGTLEEAADLLLLPAAPAYAGAWLACAGVRMAGWNGNAGSKRHWRRSFRCSIQHLASITTAFLAEGLSAARWDGRARLHLSVHCSVG